MPLDLQVTTEQVNEMVEYLHPRRTRSFTLKQIEADQVRLELVTLMQQTFESDERWNQAIDEWERRTADPDVPDTVEGVMTLNRQVMAEIKTGMFLPPEPELVDEVEGRQQQFAEATRERLGVNGGA